MDEIEIMRTCLHEVGHALGIDGHSADVNDVMYFSESAKHMGTLTRRDMVTIIRLYGRYPARNFGRYS
jgi:predicted Zn-dependent protease